MWRPRVLAKRLLARLIELALRSLRRVSGILLNVPRSGVCRLPKSSFLKSPTVIEASTSSVCATTAAEFAVIAQEGVRLPAQCHSGAKADLYRILRRSTAVHRKTATDCAVKARTDTLCPCAILTSPCQP